METPEQPPSAPPKKVRIKMGQFEFEAEGDIDDYRESLGMFMGAVEKLGPGTVVTPVTGTAAMTAQSAQASGFGTVTPAASSPPTDLTDPANANPAPPLASIGEDIINRLYRRDGDGLSLLALPRGDDGGADALMALLYGFNRLLNRQAVTGVSLMKAVKQSGINIPRVDTTLAKRQDFVLVAGSRRGRVYSLNNRGMQYAEAVLRRTLE